MYKLKPLQENLEIVHKPTCMYTMKSYYDSDKLTPEQVISESVSCDALLVRQKKIFERLSSLERRVDKLLGTGKNESKVDLAKLQKLSSSYKKVENKVNVNETVRDIVIQMDPQNINYSIFVAFVQLCSKYKCFVQFFAHGSTESNNNSDCRGFNDLFSSLKLNLNESRLKYDYGFTVVWRKSETVIYLDSANSSPIFGESNVLRFLNRLQHEQSYEKALKSTQVALVDDLIDSCTNLLRNSKDAKQNASFLKNLNDRLKNSKYLIQDDSSTLADLYVWSVLKQRTRDITLNNFQQVSQWLNRLESSEVFQLFQWLN